MYPLLKAAFQLAETFQVGLVACALLRLQCPLCPLLALTLLALTQSRELHCLAVQSADPGLRLPCPLTVLGGEKDSR